MVGHTEKSEEFEMTADEMDRIKTALKDDRFRELLIQYAGEISDPVNKKKYEEEIIAMEKQRGQDVKLLKPQSGFVVKTSQLSNNKKIFINICTSPEVDIFTVTSGIQNGAAGSHVSLPHSLTPCREDLDKAGKPCLVCDVCFHPETYQKSLQDQRFRQLLIDTAFDVLEKTLEMEIDRKNVKFPKIKYKGMPQASIIRQTSLPENEKKCTNSNNNNNISSMINETQQNPHVNSHTNSDDILIIKNNHPATPKYKIVHRGYFDLQDFTLSRENTSAIPKELVIEIELPLANSANGIDLDIFDRQLVLNSENPSYHLDISLPYKINEDDGRAQFDKSKRILIVTLPLNREITHVEIVEKPLVEEVLENDTVARENDSCSKNSENDKTNSALVIDTDSTTSTCNNHVAKREVSHHQSDIVTNSVSNSENVIDDTTMPSIDSNKITDDVVIGESSDVEKDGDVFLDNEEAVKREEVKFDTSLLETFSGSSQLPPYDCDQTIDKIIIVVNVPNITVGNISLGLAPQQVCLSFPQDAVDSYSSDWNMLIQLADGNFLETEECGFEIHEECLELNLKKSEDCLWNKIYIGVSQSSLKEEIFMTGEVTMDMLQEIEDTLKPVTENSEINQVRLEGRLQQLLDQQEMTCGDETEDDEEEKGDIALPDVTTEIHAKVSNQSDQGDDELSLKVNLLDLQDDVIEDSSPFTSPSCDDAKTLRSRLEKPRVERSMSQQCISKHRLRSILKRSKSDGANYDTDEDYVYTRTRATTLSDDYAYDSDKKEYGRRRNKSVTFNEEPIVFEFTKLSKREWKRLQKEDKQRVCLDKKVKEMLNGNKNNPTSSSGDEKKETDPKVKHGKKWKKKEKKRLRMNSESRSEEEAEVENKKSRKKKKKKNKTTNQNNPSGCSNSSGGEHDSATKPSLNNPLIFELE